MEKRKLICKISRVGIVILLPITILLSILQVYALNPNFYLKEFNKYHVSEDTKIELADLNKIVVKMVDYLKDDEKNLNIQVKIKGNLSEVFGKREKEHMVDVKKLFQQGYILRNGGVLLIGISFFLIMKISKNRTKDVYKSLLGANILSVMAIGFLFILMQIDFYKYFTYFHKIFFQNDLWLLNPKTDILIQMLPLGFFIDIAMGVVGWFFCVMVIIGIIAFYKLRKVHE
ncbi:TIGR01906 family membrane protein [Marinisporobacter balticus]|uniref:Integral membrane protein (TIGR01906 family) n=1 Tax=Marinisporobacter balticus TaxID=2018667 RepID=A0A4R2KY26_9FIRM|nr:TIGR01906 family membrane protein [Marinisporobacter balticus]TCO75178.1 integral membrane protein (TIGR01906 family) [Marinisporobacter balticus]